LIFFEDLCSFKHTMMSGLSWKRASGCCEWSSSGSFASLRMTAKAKAMEFLILRFAQDDGKGKSRFLRYAAE